MNWKATNQDDDPIRLCLEWIFNSSKDVSNQVANYYIATMKSSQDHWEKQWNSIQAGVTICYYSMEHIDTWNKVNY